MPSAKQIMIILPLVLLVTTFLGAFSADLLARLIP